MSNQIPFPAEFVQSVKDAIIDGCENNDKFFYKDLMKKLDLPEKDMEALATIRYIVKTHFSDLVEIKPGPHGGLSLKNSPKHQKAEAEDVELIKQVDDFLNGGTEMAISCKDIAQKLNLNPYDGQLRVNKVLRLNKVPNWGLKKGQGAVRLSAREKTELQK